MHEHRHVRGEKALFKTSMIFIKLSCEGALTDPSFPPRNKALNVKGKNVIEVHRRNSVIDISTCISIWTLTSVFLAQTAAPVLCLP